MEYDFAIIYFGLTRSVKKTHETHKKNVFDVLQRNNLTYKTFMHTWSTKDGTQNVWLETIPQKIDFCEHTLLSPDFYKIDDEDEFLESVDMDMYFYKDVFEKLGYDGEWYPRLISNYICMLESQKRGYGMVKTNIMKGDKYKMIMFIRPDVTIHNELPIESILANPDKYHLPNNSHYEGLNDQFAIMNNEYADIYGYRINELADFRRTNGRIVAEKYCHFIIGKYNMKINELNFNFTITRP